MSDLYADWSVELQEEIKANWNNCDVGTVVVSETDQLRIWHLTLDPGERAPFHRHDVSYFWTVTGPGKSLSHYNDGSTRIAEYKAGDTKHFDFTGDKFMVHDLENVGDTSLTFVTVEFK